MFVFFGRRRDAIKVLFHDGSGFGIFYVPPARPREDAGGRAVLA